MLSHKQITDLALPVLQLAVEAGEAILEIYETRDLQIERKADDSPLTLADRRADDLISAGLISLVSGVPVLSEEGREIPYSEREHWDELWLVDPLDGTKEFIKGNGEFTVNIGLIQNGEPVFGVIYGPVCGVGYMGITRPRDPVSLGDTANPGPDAPPGVTANPDATTALSSATGFPHPGAYRLVLGRESATGAVTVGQDLARRAERICGALPRDGCINIVASRSHMGRRTRAFVKTIGAGYREVKLLHMGSSLKLCLIAEGSASIYPRNRPTMEWDTAAGHALVRAAGGEVWQAPRDGHNPVPDWLTPDPVDTADDGDREGGRLLPLRYNKESLVNPHFVARGW